MWTTNRIIPISRVKSDWYMILCRSVVWTDTVPFIYSIAHTHKLSGIHALPRVHLSTKLKCNFIESTYKWKIHGTTLNSSSSFNFLLRIFNFLSLLCMMFHFNFLEYFANWNKFTWYIFFHPNCQPYQSNIYGKELINYSLRIGRV